MFKTKNLLIFSSFMLTILLHSCNSFNKEGEIFTDAKPPINYQQNFVKSTVPYDSKVNQQVILSAIDQRQNSNIKFRLHLLDSNNNIMQGATLNDFKKIWCFVSDSVNGKVKPIKNFNIKEYKDQPAAIALVLDHSGSMGDWRAKVMQEAVSQLIASKKDDEPIAIIRYDSETSIESPLTTSGRDLILKNPIDSLSRFGRMTAIANGINTGINELANAPKNFTKAVIVFTDGFDNSSTIKKDSVIKRAIKENVMICAVDFGEYLNPDYMKQFSDSTGGIYNRIYNTDEFKQVFDDIYKRLKNYYILDYKTSDYGVHAVKMKLCLPSKEISTVARFDNTPDLGSIGLLNVYFDFDKSALKPESDDAINGVYTLLTAYPNMKIELRGHTDSMNGTKDENYNKNLSQKRAEAVKQALVKKGIAGSRINAVGYGSDSPIATNDTEEGRALNRRTELIIQSK